ASRLPARSVTRVTTAPSTRLTVMRAIKEVVSSETSTRLPIIQTGDGAADTGLWRLVAVPDGGHRDDGPIHALVPRHHRRMGIRFAGAVRGRSLEPPHQHARNRQKDDGGNEQRAEFADGGAIFVQRRSRVGLLCEDRGDAGAVRRIEKST